MKYILSALAVILISKMSFSQTVSCEIVAESSIYNICVGDSITLSAVGSISGVPLITDFNTPAQQPGQGWSSTTSATYTNPCGPGSDGTTYLWMGSASPHPRILATNDFNVILGGTISFDLRYAIQAQASPCEGPDLNNEGVSLQYSLNGGTSWSDIIYFHPNGTLQPTNPETTGSATGANQQTAFTTWANYEFDIPVDAQSTSTRFRWIQGGSSGNNFDHWGLDNIIISTTFPTTINWYADNVFIGTEPLENPLAPTQTTEYKAVISNGFDSCQTSFVVNVFPYPEADLAVVENFCQYNQAFLDASASTIESLGTPANIVSYIWDVDGDGTVDNTTTTPSFNQSYNPHGEYTSSVVVVGTNGCADTAFTTFTVYPVPDAAFIPSTTSACDTLMTFDASGSTVDNPDNIVGYSWDFNSDGNFEIENNSETNSNYNFGGPGTYNITLIVVTNNGCYDTTSTSITLHPLPTADFSFENVCITSPAMFTNETTSNGGNPTYTYNWTFGDGASSTQTNPQHNYTNYGTYTVTLTSTTNQNCSSEISFPIEIYSVPEANFTYEANCFHIVQFANLSGDPAVSLQEYFWNFGDGNTSTEQNPEYQYQQGGGYIVELTVVNEDGCENTVSLPINVEQSVYLDDFVLPNVITANGDGINDELNFDPYFEECLNFQVYIYNRWGRMVYEWQKGGAPFNGKSLGNKELTAGVYFYIIRSEQLERNGTITVIQK
jgi:gliding motility-associated-like protein